MFSRITRRTWRQLLAASILLPLLVIGGVAGTIYLYSFQTDLTPGDAAVVLGAAVWDQKPSPVFEERIRHAVALYKAGQVKAIIFTGGLGQGDTLTEAEVARGYALNEGIPAQDIFVDEASTTTYENLLFAKAIADHVRFQRLLIVSDPLHMKRALAIAIDLGMDAHPSPTPTSKYTGLQTQIIFLARETYFYMTYLLRQLFGVPVETEQTRLVQYNCHLGNNATQHAVAGDRPSRSALRPAPEPPRWVASKTLFSS